MPGQIEKKNHDGQIVIESRSSVPIPHSPFEPSHTMRIEVVGATSGPQGKTPPPKHPRGKLAVASFGPKLMAALMKGSKEGVVFDFDHYHFALRLRMRLYQLRSAMKRENHPDTNIAMACRLYCTGKKGSTGRLELKPADAEFDDIFLKAGIATPQLTNDPLASKDFLADLMEDEK